MTKHQTAPATEPLQFDVPFTLPAHVEARAAHPALAERLALRHAERTWTYRQFRNESIRMARLLLGRLGRVDDDHPGHVAMFCENHLEVLSLFAGCGYGGLTLFGVNTGLRGDVLAGVVNQSRSRILVVDERLLPEVDRVRQKLTTVAPENVLVLPTEAGRVPDSADLHRCLDVEVGPAGKELDPPDVEVAPDRNLMVIYTSGTTGLPKGIVNTHFKFCAVGLGVSANLGLGMTDVGYTCMPLFHSNSLFVGFMPAFWVGGSVAVRERFSASSFTPDVLRYGVTFWNYVGEPVHYVLSAIDREYGDDQERIRREITENPANRFRYAVGNGASPPDIDRFTKVFGLEDMFELYGSTEAAISTFRKKGDPRGSVGEITDENVKILGADGRECPPAELGPEGQILNYDQCVGEICRVAGETGLFQGYFDNEQANREKVRNGVYHSGDLGHVLVRDGKRYLFFDGRTADWIRKDGENFSAGQVGRLLTEHPDVALGVAYGVPCAISDELVMAALKLRPDVEFDPRGFFDWCQRQVTDGNMDRKWVPDFVRVVDDFQYTETQKVLVRNLKKAHFDRNRLPDEPIWWRERGDTAFKPFTREDYERLREDFRVAEKLRLLDG